MGFQFQSGNVAFPPAASLLRNNFLDADFSLTHFAPVSSPNSGSGGGVNAMSSGNGIPMAKGVGERRNEFIEILWLLKFRSPAGPRKEFPEKNSEKSLHFG